MYKKVVFWLLARLFYFLLMRYIQSLIVGEIWTFHFKTCLSSSLNLQFERFQKEYKEAI